MHDSIAARVVRDTLDALGQPRESITTAVIIGAGDGALADAARQQLPALRSVVLVASDAHASKGGTRQVHLDLLGSLLAHGAAVGNTPCFVDPVGSPGDASPTARAVDDLLWSASAEFLAQHPSPTWLTGAMIPRIRAWADLLSSQSLVHPALRWYLALHQVAPSPTLARQIGIAWGRLGAPGRALTWLRRSDLPLTALRAVTDDLLAAAAALRDDAAATFADNLAHLRAGWPAMVAEIEATPLCAADVVWIPDVPWRLQIAGDRGLVRRDLLPILVDERDGALVELNWPQPPAILRDQLRTPGALAKRHACVGSLCDTAALVNLLRNRVVSTVPGWTQSVYAAESDAGALRRLLEAVDIRDLISTDVLQGLEVGAAAEHALAQRFADDPRLPLPRIRAACSPALNAGLAAIDDVRLAVGRAALAQIGLRDDPGWPQRTLGKLRRGEPLRVWMWTSIHTTVLQHVAAGLAAGFRALGHEVELVVETSPREQIEAPLLAKSLADFDPDLAVFIDHARPEYGQLLPRALPLVNWILDELPGLIDPHMIAQLGPCDLAFAWSRWLMAKYLEHGYPHCEQLPFAVDIDTYGTEPDAPARDVVAFATHLSFPFEPTDAPGLYRALERRMMAMDDVPSGVDDLRPLLAEVVAELGHAVPPARADELAYQCLMIARHVDRVRIADCILAAGLPLVLYGRGWADIERFAPHARGAIAPGEPLRRMYQGHKVVLHINTRCNLHPRVLEAGAAGGFVLARSDGDFDLVPGGVSDFLEVGRELCVFTDPADLVAKIRRAFTDEPWRQRFVQAARQRVRRDHTYAERARAMLDAVQRQLARVTGQPVGRERLPRPDVRAVANAERPGG